jgi:triacylglycerol lipase
VVTLGTPQVEPLAVHPLVALQLLALGTIGSLGAPGLLRRACLEGDCCREFWALAAHPRPPGVSLVSVYSRADGIVDWRSCLDPHAELVEIDASHFGMAVNAAAYHAVAAALEAFASRERRRRAPRVRRTEAAAAATAA